MHAIRHPDPCPRSAAWPQPLAGAVNGAPSRWRIAARIRMAGAVALAVTPLAGAPPARAVEQATSVTISPTEDNQFLLSWQAEMLRPYQIESSLDMVSWTEHGAAHVGGNSLKEVVVPRLGPSGYYRIRKGAVRGGFDTLAMSRGDDHCYPQFSGPAAPVDLGFSINLFGVTRSSCYVNNNGNITFDAPLFVYTPESLIKKQSVMIAPFWADVDSRNPLSGVTRFSSQPGIVNGHQAFGVTWRDVGYFSQHIDKLNTFQLVVIERADRNPGDFDIEFNYNRIEWETGDASGGSAGFGGAAARVGWTNGQGLFMEYQGSGESMALLDRLLDNSPNFQQGLIYQTWNSNLPGRVLIPVINGIPQTAAGLEFAVNAGPDVTLPGDHGRTLSLTGTLTPPDTSGVTFNWVLESGHPDTVISNPTSLNPTALIPEPGQYVFRLYGVKQGSFTATSSDAITISHPGVFEINGGFYSRAAADPLSVVLGDAFAKFNGQNVTAIQWTQLEGDKASIQSPTSINPTVVLPHSGTYRFQLRASTNHTPPFVRIVDATVMHGE